MAQEYYLCASYEPKYQPSQVSKEAQLYKERFLKVYGKTRVLQSLSTSCNILKMRLKHRNFPWSSRNL